MVAAKRTATKKSTGEKKIPDYLIREIMDGRPLYYRGYKAVLNKKKTPEEIMGSSSLQAILVFYLIESIIEGRLNKLYEVLTSEAGIHLGDRDNLAGDILIYDPAVLTPDKISVYYADVPPKVSIEVDVMIEADDLKDQQYIRRKIEKLHQFGTEKVIWILTASRQVIVAWPGKPWLVYDWNEPIELLEGVTFNIGGHLERKGIRLPD